MEIKPGQRVELFDGTCQGTVSEVLNEYCWKVLWDDDEIGYVHPLDVKHLDNN